MTDQGEADRAWSAVQEAPIAAAERLAAHRDPWAQWARGVLRASTGDYDAAFATLLPLARSRPDGDEVAGLAAARIGAVLRQIDEHSAARAWDDRAVASVGQAAVDGLIGRAADAVGVADPDLAARFLGRVTAAGPRDRIRVGWVACEISLLGGRQAVAYAHARRALATAVDWGSPRHEIKSALFAAASCRESDPGTAVALAGPALERAVELGLRPLVWPFVAVLGNAATSAQRDAANRAARHIAGHLPPGHGSAWRARIEAAGLLRIAG